MNRIDAFITHFRDAKEISQEEILTYFHSTGKINDKSIKSLISRWTKQGILSRVRKGTYLLTGERKKLFKLSSDKVQKELAALFLEQYPELKFAVWSSDNMNNLMVHQHISSFYIFETEKDVLESIFYLFKENGYNVFLADDEDILHRYMYDIKDPIVIKKLVSRSPLAKKEGVIHPSIEKILVDIFVDHSLFNFLQGAELTNIYIRAFNDYVVNTTKLLNYAERRGHRAEISDFVRDNINKIGITTL